MKNVVGWSIILVFSLFLSGCGLLNTEPKRNPVGDFDKLHKAFEKANENAAQVDLAVLSTLQHDPVATLAYAFIVKEDQKSRNNTYKDMYYRLTEIYYKSQGGTNGWDVAKVGLRVAGNVALGSVAADALESIFMAGSKGFSIDSGGGDVLFDNVGNSWTNSGAGDVSYLFDASTTENHVVEGE